MDPPRRHLGMLLRQFRQRAGLTPEDAAGYLASIARGPMTTEEWIGWETGAEMDARVFNVVLNMAVGPGGEHFDEVLEFLLAPGLYLHPADPPVTSERLRAWMAGEEHESLSGDIMVAAMRLAEQFNPGSSRQILGQLCEWSQRPRSGGSSV